MWNCIKFETWKAEQYREASQKQALDHKICYSSLYFCQRVYIFGLEKFLCHPNKVENGQTTSKRAEQIQE